jgi:hypothetical protein
MRALGNRAILRHFEPTRAAIRGGRSPCAETPEPIADGDCTDTFGEGTLNRFWLWRSGMETFSNVANQCHFGPRSAAVRDGRSPVPRRPSRSPTTSSSVHQTHDVPFSIQDARSISNAIGTVLILNEKSSIV